MFTRELQEQYNIFSSLNFLTTEADIIPYIKDIALDYFDCGQGYYEDKKDFIVYIQSDDQYYKVTVTADIMSAKQDRGDRLYWVDGINDMLLAKIDEPALKDTTPRTLTVQAYQYNKAIDLLCKADISVV